METVPWYQSAIVRQQIAQLVVAATALFGVNLGGLDVDATLVSIFSGIAALVAVYTIVTRIFKPAPNLSQTAAKKEVEMVAEGKIPASPTGPGTKQGGYIRPMQAVMVAALALFAAAAVLGVPGCAGTKAAYKEAQGLSETAFVVTEHYAALVHEAANLAQSPTTDPEVKAALKTADNAVRPVVLGDPATGLPSLQQLAANYDAVKNAETEAALQAALNNAVRELAKLINAVKAARRP